MDNVTTRAMDMIGPLRAQIALCYGLVTWTGDSLESWRDDLSHGLHHALMLADALGELLAQSKPDIPETKKRD